MCKASKLSGLIYGYDAAMMTRRIGVAISASLKCRVVHVDHPAKVSWTVSQPTTARTLERIDKLVKQYGILALRECYCQNDILDCAGSAMRLMFADGRRKTIRHYHGDTSTPANLHRFEKALLRAVTRASPAAKRAFDRFWG
jgi:hypothetical protein